MSKVADTVKSGERRLIHHLRKKGLGYALVLPAAASSLLMIAITIIRGAQISFYQSFVFRPAAKDIFMGWGNYTKALTDPVFWRSLRLSLYWTFGSVAAQFALGLLVALLLSRQIPGRAIFRGMILTPWVVPTALAAMMWATMLAANGLINKVLIRVGLLHAFTPWLANSKTALPAVTLVNVWKQYPFFVIMLLAGLQAIPKDLYDAAAVDGAGPWQQLRYVTLPLLMPTISVSVLLQTVWTFKLIDFIMILTKGGPGRATNTLTFYAYSNAFIGGYLGYASALAIIVSLILLAFTIASRLLEEKLIGWTT